MKRPKGSGMPEIGFVVQGRTWVYLGNVMRLETGKLEPQLAGIPAKQYASFEEMLADGWVVD